MILKKSGVSPGKTIGFGQLSLAAGMVCFFTAMVLGRHGAGGIGADEPGSGSIVLIVTAAVLFGLSLPLNIRGIRELRKKK
jgi:hypothetical protein